MDRNQSGNTDHGANLGSGIKLFAIADVIVKRIKANKKLKTPLLFAAIGAAILLLFPREESVPAISDAVQMAEISEVSVDQQISQILSAVEGAGAVRVMLTIRSEGETEYQTDRDETTRDGESVVRTTTVFGGNTADSALIRKKTSAEYLGAVVVAEGADSAEVCYMLKMAVGSLTGLPSHKITVLKMK